MIILIKDLSEFVFFIKNDYISISKASFESFEMFSLMVTIRSEIGRLNVSINDDFSKFI